MDLGDLGIVDVHIHIGPEFGSSDHTAVSLERESAPVNTDPIMKNHFIPTTCLASLAETITGQPTVLGSVVPNHNVGNINVQAVRAILAVTVIRPPGEER